MPKTPLPPRLTEGAARRLARRLWGLEAAARPLPSYRDQNFLLEGDGGEAFVLKIANADVPRELLEMEHRALEHLAAAGDGVPSCPRVRPTAAGEEIAAAGEGGGEHLVRLLTYLPGTPLAEAHPHTPELLEDLGRALGALDRALAGLRHPPSRQDFEWDPAKAGWIAGCVDHLGSAQRRGLVEGYLSRWREIVEPALPALRQSVVHGDANFHNVLVGYPGGGSKQIAGLIDFGDLRRTVTAGELAVAMTYPMLGKSDPLAAAACVVRGYYRAHPLTDGELAILFDLACLRLCVSVTMSALEARRQPGNEYLEINQAQAWELLERLAGIDPHFAHYTFRDACGLDPCPRQPAVVAWLAAHRQEMAPVVSPDPRSTPALPVDLSAGSLDFGHLAPDTSADVWEEEIRRRLTSAGAALGVGPYDEARWIYTAEPFRCPGQDGDRWRTVHLGIDLFLPPGTPVLAPLPGTVHSFRDNDLPLDYGPTVILEHWAGEIPFWTLYGHLSRESLGALVEGVEVERGGKIGEIGDRGVNGGWAPHLHFQLVLDLLGRRGEFPGVAPPEERRLWKSLSPDPNLVLGLPAGSLPTASMRGEEILERRRRALGPSLSVSYRRPLTLVRGRGVHLWDEDARIFLDGVNNVAHVGHCHPKVIAAQQRQAAVLNTNTRYLHRNLVRYAERLLAKLPEPLSVCYFVCSGSEANELALRLARAHTRRTGVVTVGGGYHGNTQALVDVSPYKFRGPGGQGPPPHVIEVSMPDPYRGRFRAPEPRLGERYAAEVTAAAAELAVRGFGACAFICESLLSCGGQIVLPEGYLAATFRRAREAGAVAIADEVQVGFGRTGTHFWGFETQGVVPDVVTLGKPIGNGHPLAAVVTTPEIAASFDNGMEYFNTYGGNPVSCAVGLAVLEVIEQEGLQEHARVVGAHLVAGLETLAERFPLIGDVRGLGLFLGAELVRDRATREPATEEAGYVVDRLRDKGVLLSTDGPDHNVLKIKPPLVFSETDADRLLAALEEVLSEDVLQGSRGFRPPGAASSGYPC